MNELSSPVLIKTAIALLILLVTFLAGWYPFKKHLRSGQGYTFPIGESLACGVFLGAGLLHMLAEATTKFTSAGFHYPLASLLTGATFLLFLWLEHIGREVYEQSKHCEKPKCRTQKGPYFSLLAVLMLSIHSILEGAALGLTDEYSVVAVLFLAILGHKWLASFSVAVYLNKGDLSRKTNLLLFMLFTLMTPLGIFLGACMATQLHHGSLMVPVFSSLAAGTFLYLGTLHGLEKGVLINQCCNLKHFSFVIIGFGIMAVIAAYA